MKTATIKPFRFHEGSITAQFVADSIAGHSVKKNIGAHSLFLGQVRADDANGKTIAAIDYSAYRDMAERAIAIIREEIIIRHQLTCAHIAHSIGRVEAGEICLFVFTSSPHRQAAITACNEMVERIKNEVPIFGREIFDDHTFQWKENKPL